MTVPDEPNPNPPEQRTTMSAEVEQLTEDIRNLGIAVVSGPPVDLAGPLAQHLIKADYRKPRTITTVEELDALSKGSVVLDADGDSFQFDSDYWRLAGYGDNFRSHEIPLPATVLYEREATLRILPEHDEALCSGTSDAICRECVASA